MIGVDGAPPQREVVERMAEAIRHRGPDDHGCYLSGHVGLGFRRLSILDLSPAGHQPMLSPDGRVAIVFNGEIYNYVELREELTRLGHVFHSSGDTEVLLHAYLQWGTACVERFNGMWAFLIHDTRINRVIASRDRFGKKPLYWHRSGAFLLFASEIKGILASGLYERKPNWTLVSQWLYGESLDQIPTHGRTFYDGIQEVEAGTVVQIDPRGTMVPATFWTYPQGHIVEDQAESIEGQFRDLFVDAVRVRMRSDVPVGVFLSGGLDSTSITCMLAKLRESSRLGLQEKVYAFSFQSDFFDERRYIQDTVTQTGVELVSYSPDASTLWKQVEKMLWYQDEPVHSFVAVITFELCRLAAERGVKVILNGGGSDEYLAGYLSFFHNYWYDLFKRQGVKAVRADIAKYCRLHGEDEQTLFAQAVRRRLLSSASQFPPYRWLSAWKRKQDIQKHPWFTQELGHHFMCEQRRWDSPSLDNALCRAVTEAPLPHYVRLEDRNSMAHSIEARMPFLDHRLVSFGARLPGEWKLRDGLNKYVLRQAMEGHIPESARTRHEKWGFPIPKRQWIEKDLFEPILDLIKSRSAKERGIYNVNVIERDLELHRAGQKDVSKAVFKVAQFELWSNLTGRRLF